MDDVTMYEQGHKPSYFSYVRRRRIWFKLWVKIFDHPRSLNIGISKKNTKKNIEFLYFTTNSLKIIHVYDNSNFNVTFDCNYNRVCTNEYTTNFNNYISYFP